MGRCKKPSDVEKKLRNLYWRRELSLREIAELFNVNMKTIRAWMNEYGIERRNPREAARVRFRRHPEQRKKLSEAHKGKKLSDKHRRSISKALQARKHFLGKLYGRKLSEREKKKLRRQGREWGNQILEDKTRAIGHSLTLREERDPEHTELVEMEAEELQKQGFDIIKLHYGYPIPDIIALKSDKVYAVEVETGKKIQPDFEKYRDIPFYDDVIWIVVRRRLGGSDE